MAARLKKILGFSPENTPSYAPNFWHTLSGSDLADLMRVAESGRFLELLPPLENKTNFYITESESPYLFQKISETQKQTLLELRHAGKSKTGAFNLVQSKTLPHSYAAVEADPMALPFKSETADVLLAPLANTIYRLETLLSEWARVLKNEGRGVVSLMHPALHFSLKNPNIPYTFESLWALLRQHNFYVEQMIETVVDKNTRPFFVSSNADNLYDEYRGHPLVLTLKLVKYRR
ncbi:methyltransferase domain-containing protein [bacterium]|nr:methyltransferase domain-containing protein [bacterium]